MLSEGERNGMNTDASAGNAVLSFTSCASKPSSYIGGDISTAVIGYIDSDNGSHA